MVVVSYTHTQSLPLLVLTSCAALDRWIDNPVYELYDLMRRDRDRRSNGAVARL
jgi:hypothetical protein